MITLELTDQQMKKLQALSDFIPLLYDLFKPFRKENQGPVTERIKTYEDACRELGRKPYDEARLTGMGLDSKDIAYLKLTVIVEALNEGWIPDVCDINVYRWFPYFRPNDSPSSFAFRGSVCDDEDAFAGCGSRLALKNEELANYCGRQFIDLWKEFLL